MNHIVFSGSSIQGIIFSIFLTIFVPIAYLWYYKKKKEIKISSFFIGIAFSLLFSFIGATLLNTLILGVLGAGTFLSANVHPVYSSLYAAFSAGLMAGLGSYIGLKYAMKNRSGMDNAVTFGVGKGALECILNGGTIYITNLIAALLINAVGSEEYFKKLGLQGKELAETRQLFAQQAAIPAFSYLMDATYLLIALCLHVSLTVLIAHAIHNIQSHYLVVFAIFLHVLGYVPMYLSKQNEFQNSILLLSISVVYAFIVCVISYRLYRSDSFCQ